MSSTPRSAKKAAVIMFLYAGIVIGLSLLAYSSAPPGANAVTALIMGGGSAVVMIVMGILTLMLHRNRKLGMFGIHVGMVLPLVFAAAFFMRIAANYKSAGVHDYFYGAYNKAVDSGTVADTRDARSAFLDGGRNAVNGGEIPDHSKAYLGQVLTLLFGVSAATFTMLLASRPSVPPKRDAFDAPASDTPPKADAKKADAFG